MIPDIELRIFNKMNITESLLRIREKYIKGEEEVRAFKKNEILKIFKDLKINCQYINGGAYVIDKEHENFLFNLSFNIRYNIPLEYIYIYKDKKLIEPRLTNLRSTLRYLPYNEALINKNFGLNSLEDLKNYIKDMVVLFNEFVEEYINEIETKNLP